MTAARKALRTLLGRADRAEAGASPRGATLRLSAASCPEYVALPTWAAKDAFHAEMRDAERAGAITIEWDAAAGEYGQIKRIRAVSAANLATFLGERTLSERLVEAEAELAEWSNRRSVVPEIIARWRAGQSPRGISLERFRDVVDAMRVLDERDASDGRDESERRVSARLFRDSKRIEAIYAAIDLAVSGFGPGARPREEVLASIGLVRHPSPILITGNAAALTVDGHSVQRFETYIGFSPRSTFGIRADGGCGPAYILTIENLTTFNEIAVGLAGATEGIVLYTGGMPSPSMLRAVGEIYRGVPGATPLYHWGDTDAGGFRIASLYADTAGACGRNLKVWRMGDYSGLEQGGRPLSEQDIKTIESVCRRHGWADALSQILERRLALEQELQTLALPEASS